MLSRRFEMDITAEGAEAMYEYYRVSGDRTYTMVVWSKREEKMIGQVIKEAESGLKVMLDVEGDRSWKFDVEEGLAGW